MVGFDGFTVVSSLLEPLNDDDDDDRMCLLPRVKNFKNYLNLEENPEPIFYPQNLRPTTNR